MAAVLSQFLCICCSRRPHTAENDEPDERTQLIRPPAENETASNTTNYAVDHQQLKERLGTIVRAKEGKMVNVNTPLPFNLRNKDLDGRRQDPSSSRSVRSRSAHPAIGGYAGYGPEMLPDVPSRMPSSSPIRDRDQSPSLQTSQSTTSLHPGDASYLPPDSELENGDRQPILNARLVKGAGGFGIGGDFASRPRQGRSLTRGRSARADAAPVAEESRDVGGTVIPDGPHVENGDASAEQSAEATTDSTPRAAAFKIEDVGKIACSWGD